MSAAPLPRCSSLPPYCCSHPRSHLPSPRWSKQKSGVARVHWCQSSHPRQWEEQRMTSDPSSYPRRVDAFFFVALALPLSRWWVGSWCAPRSNHRPTIDRPTGWRSSWKKRRRLGKGGGGGDFLTFFLRREGRLRRCWLDAELPPFLRLHHHRHHHHRHQLVGGRSTKEHPPRRHLF